MGIPANSSIYTDADIGLGKVAEHHPLNSTRTLICEGDIKFGSAVMYGTAQTQGKNFSSATGIFIGVAAHSTDATNLDTLAYADKDVLGVMESGMITVHVEEAVALGDPVRIRHTNHASTATLLAGQFAVTVEAGKTAVLTGAEWRSTTSGAGEVKLFLKGGTYTITADTL